MAKTWPDPVRWVSVAVPVPFLDVLTYQVPDGAASPARGARVVVPLGKRVVTGIVVNAAATLDTGQTSADKIKNIIDVLDDHAFLPEPIVNLALWVAEYYACGAGDALAAAVPSTQAHKTIRIATLTAQGHDQQAPVVLDLSRALPMGRALPSGGALPSGRVVSGQGLPRERSLSTRQKEAIDLLRGAPHGMPVSVLNERGISADVLQRLAAKGLIAFRHQRIE